MTFPIYAKIKNGNQTTNQYKKTSAMVNTRYMDFLVTQ